eukprot:scaffold6821_cov127-Cylindrotheca_fusiformis.AAC.6
MESDHFSLPSGNYDIKEFGDATSRLPPFHETGDETQQTGNRPIVPRPCDVLFGNTYKLHAGNLRLCDILAQHAGDYEEICGRLEKIEFAAQLLRKIKAMGTRFLAHDKTSMQWLELTDSIARNKISKSIRNRRRSFR